MTVKAGYNAAVWYGTDYKIGTGNWTWDGGERTMQAKDQFGDVDIEEIPLQRTGGTITITGNYLLDSDTGQKQLVIDYAAGTKITNLRLYTDKSNSIYITPKATGLNGGQSHVIVTNATNVGVDKSGIGTFSATLKVYGTLEQVGSTTAVAVTTIGDINPAHGGAGADNATVTLWGELIHRGGEAGDIDCYFEWGLTDSFGLDSSGSPEIFSTPDKDNFEADLTSLTESSTYYYRAVAELADTSKVYGETKTFDIPADV